jgi:hypothetical protein
VNMTEVAMSAAITLSIAGVSYAAVNTEALTHTAQTVADEADCHAVNAAIVAYVAQYDRQPTLITQLEPFVRGDISRYTVAGGVAAGPGC